MRNPAIRVLKGTREALDRQWNAFCAYLAVSQNRLVLYLVLWTMNRRFYHPEALGDEWKQAIARHRPQIERAQTPAEFEKAVMRLLQELKASHVGLFHKSARRVSSQAALNATYLEDETAQGKRWIFQVVHDGGPAAQAQIRPGDMLLRVGEKEIQPPEHPVFAMRATTEITILAGDGKLRTAEVVVGRPKEKDLHFVEPKLAVARWLEGGIGYLKVAMFPGIVGVEVANAISQEIARLGDVDRLVIDLRGNRGGGNAVLRVMSLLTPNKVPVGFSLDRKWAGKNVESRKAHFFRFRRIPASTRFLKPLALCYGPLILLKLPIVLVTEGLGAKPFHGRVVLLVDRHTASAAEMIVAFARENSLATIVGEKTAGRLLAADSFWVGFGYRLALPTGGYYTWKGSVIEGAPIEPDVPVLFDWLEARRGNDRQLARAISVLNQAPDSERRAEREMN